jgi:hypothetical protein
MRLATLRLLHARRIQDTSSMKPPLRIAILECDTPLPETKAQYGGYGGVFEALLKAGADALGQPDVISSTSGLELSKFHVVNEDVYPELDSIDAILLTGSSEIDLTRIVLFSTDCGRTQRI